MGAPPSTYVRLVVEVSVKTCAIALLILLLCIFGWAVNLLLIAPLSDPLYHLPGPKGTFLESHLELVMNPAFSQLTHKNWRSRFGQSFRFHGFGRHDLRLMTFDTRALIHILNESTYDKPWQTRSFFARLIGNGLISAEGAEHAKQRRIIGPAFSQEAIRRMSPIFLSKAQEVLEQWKSLQSASDTPHSTPKSLGTIVDVANWMSRAAFDVIGLAGFAQDFNAVHDESSDVYYAYRSIFNIADKGLGFREIVELYFPPLRKYWVNADTRTVNDSFKVINRLGKSVITERKEMAKFGGLNEKSDLLSILVTSNLSTKSSKRLSDRELLDQCSTFLMAGSDSVSVALAWCFHLLAHHPEVQNRLRKELADLQVSARASGTADLDDISRHRHCKNATGSFNASKTLEDIEYLDFFVKEVLRFCPPVHATIRVAKKDDLIPVSAPITLPSNDPVTGDQSRTAHIKIRKGTYIHVPIEGLSYSEDVWGADALEFNPDRWKDIERMSTTKRPGLLGLMTFGAGHHSCLGHRFTIAEMKVFLSVLVPRFQFDPPPDVEIRKFNSVLTRPYVHGKWSEGPQLPVAIRLIL